MTKNKEFFKKENTECPGRKKILRAGYHGNDKFHGEADPLVQESAQWEECLLCTHEEADTEWLLTPSGRKTDFQSQWEILPEGEEAPKSNRGGRAVPSAGFSTVRTVGMHTRTRAHTQTQSKSCHENN